MRVYVDGELPRTAAKLSRPDSAIQMTPPGSRGGPGETSVRVMAP
jgi:hypothetical protein